MKSGVYKITNLVNGKCYIGSSTDIKHRLYVHKYLLERNKHDNKHLQNSWNKFGDRFFKFEILFFCRVKLLLIREQEMIDFYQSSNTKKGYNICGVAGSCVGIKRSEDTRNKMKGNTNGKGRKGKMHTEETKLKMHKARLEGLTSGEIIPGMSGKIHTEESKEKMSISHIGKVSPRKGCKLSLKQIQRIVETNTGNKYRLGKRHSEETKNKISIVQIGKVLSKEHREKISKSLKKFYSIN